MPLVVKIFISTMILLSPYVCAVVQHTCTRSSKRDGSFERTYNNYTTDYPNVVAESPVLARQPISSCMFPVVILYPLPLRINLLFQMNDSL